MPRKTTKKAGEPGRAMDQQPPADRPVRRARGKKFEGGELLGTVWHKGKTYGPGQEEAFSKAGVTAEALQMLADKGQLTGFDTEARQEEEEAEKEDEE